MTDATTGSGTEGAPRDGKPRGRATRPATPPGHDPLTDPPTATPHGEPSEGPMTTARDTDAPAERGGRTSSGGTAADGGAARGREPGTSGGAVPGHDTSRGGRDGTGGLGGETASGRDSAANPANSAHTADPAAPRDASGGTHADPAAGARGREETALTGSGTGRGTGGGTGTGGAQKQQSHGSGLLPRDECDKLSQRLQHAVAGFVDGPRDAVAEADHVLEEAAARLTEAVTQRRRTLRTSWQATDDGNTGKPATSADTEQLRLALRDYRELADRLLRM
ncbi:hypothetical protein ACWD0J_23705 [Streptomyces sp. NPDC003011]